jgi:PAS domain S-box-containing protein
LRRCAVRLGPYSVPLVVGHRLPRLSMSSFVVPTKSFPMCPLADEITPDWRDALAELALDCIITIDHGGNIVEFNPAAEQTFGHLRADVLGTCLADLIIPDEHRGAHSEGLRHFLATGEGPVIGKRIELEGIRANGERFPVELAINAVGRHDAKPLFTAYLRDISERTRASQALAESEARLRQVTEHVDSALWLSERDSGEIVHVSPAYEPVFGASIESLRNDPTSWNRQVHPDDREALLHAWPAKVDARNLDLEFRVRDGAEERWVHLRVFPVREGDGGVSRVAWLGTDITQRKQSERAYLRAGFMVDRVSDAIYWIDSEGGFEYVNDAACRQNRRTRSELVERTIFDIDVNMTRDVWDPLWQDLRDKGAVTMDSAHQRENGSTYPVEISANFIAFDGREFNCAIVRDISKRRKSDDVLRSALESAKQANQAKDVFLANLSHEFRTPLAAMLGYSELIASKTRDDPQLAEWMRIVNSNGEYLNRILGDILDLSRIESGQIALEPRQFRLVQLLALVEATFEPRAESKGLSFTMTIEGEVPLLITSDAARLRQILTNLLSNATKYTTTGGICLRVAASRASEGKLAQVTFQIEDTGFGIPPARQKEVFERFVRLEEAEVAGSQGVGLGLAIVQRIVESMNGYVDLRSVEGLGTNVCVVLPLEGAEDWGALDPARIRSEGADTEPMVRELTGRILVADDVPVLAHLFATWLRRCGLDVVMVHDGESALRLAREESFDLLLLDWSMPGKDGLEVARALRADGSNVPIVAITAHVSLAARETALRAGCDAYLVKPAGEHQLLSLVARLLDSSDRRKPPVVQDRESENDQFEELRGRYAESLQAEIAWFGPTLVARSWFELSVRAHRIKGTSGSFLLDNVSEAARLLEQACAAEAPVLAEAAIAQLVAEIEALQA